MNKQSLFFHFLSVYGDIKVRQVSNDPSVNHETDLCSITKAFFLAILRIALIIALCVLVLLPPVTALLQIFVATQTGDWRLTPSMIATLVYVVCFGALWATHTIKEYNERIRWENNKAEPSLFSQWIKSFKDKTCVTVQLKD